MKLFIGAKAVVQRQDDKVLIVRESAGYKEGTNVGRFDVVGGRIEPTETLLDGLRREVREESGLEVQVGQVLHVADTFNEIKGERVHIVRIYFKCTTDAVKATLSADHTEQLWINPKEASKYDLMADVAIAITALE